MPSLPLPIEIRHSHSDDPTEDLEDPPYPFDLSGMGGQSQTRSIDSLVEEFEAPGTPKGAHEGTSFLQKVDQRLEPLSKAATEGGSDQPADTTPSPKRTNVVERLQAQIETLTQEIETLDDAIATAQYLATRNSSISNSTLFMSILLPLVVVAVSSFSDFALKTLIITALSIMNVGASALTYAFNLYPDQWFSAVDRHTGFRRDYSVLKEELLDLLNRDPTPSHPNFTNPFDLRFTDTDSLCTRARKLFRDNEKHKLQDDFLDRARRNEERKARRFVSNQAGGQFATGGTNIPSSTPTLPIDMERGDSALLRHPRSSFDSAGEHLSVDSVGASPMRDYGSFGSSRGLNSHSRSPARFPRIAAHYNSFFESPPRQGRSRDLSQHSDPSQSRSMVRNDSTSSMVEIGGHLEDRLRPVIDLPRPATRSSTTGTVTVSLREHRWEMVTSLGRFQGDEVDRVLAILSEAWPHLLDKLNRPDDRLPVEIDLDTLGEGTLRKLYKFVLGVKPEPRGHKGKGRVGSPAKLHGRRDSPQR